MFRYRMKKLTEVMFTLMALLSFVATSYPPLPCPANPDEAFIVQAYGFECEDTLCEPWSLESGQSDWQTTWHTQDHKALKLLGEDALLLGTFKLPYPGIKALALRASISGQAEVHMKIRTGNAEQSFDLLPGDWSEQVFELENDLSFIAGLVEDEPDGETTSEETVLESAGETTSEEMELESGGQTASIEISKTGKGEVLIYDFEFRLFIPGCQ